MNWHQGWSRLTITYPVAPPLPTSMHQRPDAEVTEVGPLPSAGEEMRARSRQLRTGTKQEMLIGMLRRLEGATVPEVVTATSWLPHTVRGAIAGALKKKLGLQISSEKIEGRGRVYRIRG